MFNADQLDLVAVAIENEGEAERAGVERCAMGLGALADRVSEARVDVSDVEADRAWRRQASSGLTILRW